MVDIKSAAMLAALCLLAAGAPEGHAAASVTPGTSMTAAGRVDSAAERRAIVAPMLRQDRSGDLRL